MRMVAAVLLMSVGYWALTAQTAIAQRLTATDVTEQMQQVPGWGTDGQNLCRTYQFANFVEAIDFVNQLVEPAESAGHHPDIAVSYNQVALKLTTHDAGGLTQLDFNLAQTISYLGGTTPSSTECSS
jgi:4a-hydroxytetrahydrobiopterin dehydratase